MSRRGLIWVPVAAMCLAAGVIGWGLGLRSASLSESEVIARVAAHYVAQAGPDARTTDCSAVPGQAPGVWLVVRCGAGHPWVVHVDRRGIAVPLAPRGPEA